MSKGFGWNANVSVEAKLARELLQYQRFQIFINTIIGTVVAFLAILSVQLIYSLMLSDVEEKTFEFGMLRALGFNTDNIMGTILTQSFMFSIPGLALGIGTAALINSNVRKIMYKLIRNQMGYDLSFTSIVIGLAIGIFVPIISNIVPI